MNNDIKDKQAKSPKMPLSFRLKYMFSGYKTQLFIDSVRKKAPICILAILIVLTVVYIFLHPIDKIVLRYFFARSCTIEVIAEGPPLDSNPNQPYVSKVEILLDGDWIKADGEYYNLVDGKIYRYYRVTFGEWEKVPYENNLDLSRGTKLFDKNNYVRDMKNPFVWKLKEDVDEEIHDLNNIRIERVNGFIAIVGETQRNESTYEVTLCFRGFGTTSFELPWDE